MGFFSILNLFTSHWARIKCRWGWCYNVFCDFFYFTIVSILMGISEILWRNNFLDNFRFRFIRSPQLSSKVHLSLAGVSLKNFLCLAASSCQQLLGLLSPGLSHHLAPVSSFFFIKSIQLSLFFPVGSVLGICT